MKFSSVEIIFKISVILRLYLTLCQMEIAGYRKNKTICPYNEIKQA